MSHQRLIQNSIVVVVLIILTLCVWYGFRAGRDIARTRVTATNVASIQQGLEFFYHDQNRYPSLTEYEDSKLMDIYFNNFPPEHFMYETCTPSYQYSTFRQLSFALDFCLPRSMGALVKGKNTITEKSPLLRN
jgi:hypothetical protein